MEQDATSPVIIVNPAAGGGRCGKQLSGLRSQLTTTVPAAEKARWLMTEGPGHARALAAEHYRAGTRHFWSVGGDGTAFELINGLFDETDMPAATLALIPAGTGNSFLRQFGIKTQAQAVAALRHGGHLPVDVMRLEHDQGVLHAVNLVCLGFAAQVGDLANRRYKRLGPLGYIAAVFNGLINPWRRVLPYTLDQQLHRDDSCTMLAICNSRFTGGAMEIAPKARVADGQMDVIHLGAISRFGLATALPRLFRGTHVNLDAVAYSQAAVVDFQLQAPCRVLVDGEIERLWLQTMRILPGRLQVVCGNHVAATERAADDTSAA